MRFGIKLRGDLAKPDDAEIASRYEALIAEKVARHKANPSQALGSKWLYRIGEWMIWRGPFHARIFYKAQLVLLSIWAGYKTGDWVIPDVDGYLQECELKDVTDEIRRRIRHRAKQRDPAGVTP
jgi:hypothetical protein